MKKNNFARGEFMEFIDAFLDAHPEVVEDQKRGWNIYWHPVKLDQDNAVENVKDVLAEDMLP